MAEPSLTDLPLEVLFLVARRVEAPDLCALSGTCRLLHYVATDDVLWRELYEGRWGCPSPQLVVTELDVFPGEWEVTTDNNNNTTTTTTTTTDTRDNWSGVSGGVVLGGAAAPHPDSLPSPCAASSLLANFGVDAFEQDSERESNRTGEDAGAVDGVTDCDARGDGGESSLDTQQAKGIHTNDTHDTQPHDSARDNATNTNGSGSESEGDSDSDTPHGSESWRGKYPPYTGEWFIWDPTNKYNFYVDPSVRGVDAGANGGVVGDGGGDVVGGGGGGVGGGDNGAGVGGPAFPAAPPGLGDVPHDDTNTRHSGEDSDSDTDDDSGEGGAKGVPFYKNRHSRLRVPSILWQASYVRRHYVEAAMNGDTNLRVEYGDDGRTARFVPRRTQTAMYIEQTGPRAARLAFAPRYGEVADIHAQGHVHRFNWRAFRRRPGWADSPVIYGFSMPRPPPPCAYA